MSIQHKIRLVGGVGMVQRVCSFVDWHNDQRVIKYMIPFFCVNLVADLRIR